MWTFTSGHGSYGTRLYLCGPHNAMHAKRVLFRDWLRSHPDDAADYVALKRRLAKQANGDWKFYTGGKAEFVASIVRQASTWSSCTGELSRPACLMCRGLRVGRRVGV